MDFVEDLWPWEAFGDALWMYDLKIRVGIGQNVTLP